MTLTRKTRDQLLNILASGNQLMEVVRPAVSVPITSVSDPYLLSATMARDDNPLIMCLIGDKSPGELLDLARSLIRVQQLMSGISKQLEGSAL